MGAFKFVFEHEFEQRNGEKCKSSFPSCSGVWYRKDMRETIEWRKNNTEKICLAITIREGKCKNKFQLRTTKSDKLKNVM